MAHKDPPLQEKDPVAQKRQSPSVFRSSLLEEGGKKVIENLFGQFDKAVEGKAYSEKVKEQYPALRAKYGEVETKLFLEAVLDISKINTRLFDRAVNNLDLFMEKEPSRAVLIETAEALNTAIYSADPIGTLMLCSRFEAMLRLKRYQLWKIPSYMELEPGPLVLAPLLAALETRFGRTAIDLSGLIEMAKEIPENAREIFEGKTEESGRWIELAMRRYNIAAVVADPRFVSYLQKLATLLSRPVSMEVLGEGFSTDGSKVFIPKLFDHFNTREENVHAYEYSIFHESEGHIAGDSFVVDVFALELERLGYSIADPNGYYLMDVEGNYLCDYSGNPLQIKGTFDVLRCFGDFLPLAKDILNIVEDKRCDARVIRRRIGIAEDYAKQNEKYLPFRPKPTDEEKPEHLIEAFLQLAIVGKTNIELKGKLKERAEELLGIYNECVPLEAEDATQSFNATIRIFLKLKEWYDLEKLERVPVLIPFRQWEKHNEDMPVKRVKLAQDQLLEIPGSGHEPVERKEEDPELDEKNWYAEWDFERGKMIDRHTHVKEMIPEYGELPRVDPRLANTVKVAFMRLKPTEVVEVERQRYGRIPREALVGIVKDRIFGKPPDRDIRTVNKVEKRSIAVAVLWDGSGSTSAPINGSTVFEIEGQAVGVFASAAKTLGDTLAVYVYNSEGRTRTNVHVVKEFDEQKTRFKGLQPNNANRDGCALRHATKKLLERSEEREILIHICDAYPADDGKYGGEYGEKDVSKAVEEAVRKGITVFAIVVRQTKKEEGEKKESKSADPKSKVDAQETATRIYGKGRAKVLSDIRDFPKLAPFLYRALTGV